MEDQLSVLEESVNKGVCQDSVKLSIQRNFRGSQSKSEGNYRALGTEMAELVIFCDEKIGPGKLSFQTAISPAAQSPNIKPFIAFPH